MRKKSPNVIHFQDGDIGLVNTEWDRIKNPEKAPSFRDIRERYPDTDFSAYRDFDQFITSLCDDEIQVVFEYKEACIKEYTEKKRILLRAICDFISGMTDTYALSEFRKLVC